MAPFDRKPPTAPHYLAPLLENLPRPLAALAVGHFTRNPPTPFAAWPLPENRPRLFASASYWETFHGPRRLALAACPFTATLSPPASTLSSCHALAAPASLTATLLLTASAFLPATLSLASSGVAPASRSFGAFFLPRCLSQLRCFHNSGVSSYHAASRSSGAFFLPRCHMSSGVSSCHAVIAAPALSCHVVLTAPASLPRCHSSSGAFFLPRCLSSSGVSSCHAVIAAPALSSCHAVLAAPASLPRCLSSSGAFFLPRCLSQLWCSLLATLPLTMSCVSISSPLFSLRAANAPAAEPFFYTTSWPSSTGALN
jgi:hypothetical protein